MPVYLCVFIGSSEELILEYQLGTNWPEYLSIICQNDNYAGN